MNDSICNLKIKPNFFTFKVQLHNCRNCDSFSSISEKMSLPSPYTTTFLSSHPHRWKNVSIIRNNCCSSFSKIKKLLFFLQLFILLSKFTHSHSNPFSTALHHFVLSLQYTKLHYTFCSSYNYLIYFQTSLTLIPIHFPLYCTILFFLYNKPNFTTPKVQSIPSFFLCSFSPHHTIPLYFSFIVNQTALHPKCIPIHLSPYAFSTIPQPICTPNH